MLATHQPPLLVPSILWGGVSSSNSYNEVGGRQQSSNNNNLYKVPYHTFGTAKKRFLRLKPFVANADNNSNNSSGGLFFSSSSSSSSSSPSYVEVALVSNNQDSSTNTNKYYIVKAAYPLSLVWDDPSSSSSSSFAVTESNSSNNTSSSSLLSSPIFKRKNVNKNNNINHNNHELLLQDLLEIRKGNSTCAFQAYMAKKKNGTNNNNIPNDENCCFSLVSVERTVDFYIQSSTTTSTTSSNTTINSTMAQGNDGNSNATTSKEREEDASRVAFEWIHSLQTLLDNFHKRETAATTTHRTSIGIGGGMVSSITRPPVSSSSSSSSKSLPQYNQKQQQQQQQQYQWDESLHATQLFNAVKSSDIGTIRYYLDTHGCPIDYMDKKSSNSSTHGDTILLMACRLGLFNVARVALLGYHARNDPHPSFGQTALQIAVSSGHTSIVTLILQTAQSSNNADTVIVNHEGNSETPYGEAPIHIASRCGSLDILKVLIRHGANLGLIDGRGMTCLHHCCAYASSSSSSSSSASSASASNHHQYEDCLLLVLDNGADLYLEVRSHDGYTALHLAVRANNVECVRVLLQAGADVTTEAENGLNVFTMASKQRISDRIMKLLLEYDVVSEEDEEGGDTSYYGSYNDDEDEDDDSSSEEEDMFRGLNKYNNISPSMNPNLYHGGGGPPYNENGSLVSPTTGQSPIHMNHLNRRPTTPLYYTGGGADIRPIHQTIVAGGGLINHSPIVGVNHHHMMSTSTGYGSNGHYFTQQQQQQQQQHQHHVRFDTNNLEDGKEFVHGGEIWKIYTSNDGYPYYYNVNQNESSWEDPRAATATYYASPSSPHVGHTPQHLSYYESPPSYKKKLTAIPVARMSSLPSASVSTTPSRVDASTNQLATPQHQPANSNTVVEEQTQSNAVVVESTKIRRHLPMNQNQSTLLSATPAPIKPKEANNNQETEIADPKIMLMAHIKSRAVGDGSSGSDAKTKTPKNPKPDHNPSSSEMKDGVDPKSTLLAQIKSHTAGSSTPVNTLSTIQKENVDPKSMLMAHIKSRANNGGGNSQSSTDIDVPEPGSSLTPVVEEEVIDPKSVLMAHIKSRASDAQPTTTQPSSSQPPSDDKTGNTNAANDDLAIDKYIRMKAVGVPSTAILYKMKHDGVDAAEIKAFRSSHIDSQQSAESSSTQKVKETAAIISPKRQSKERLKQMLMQDDDCICFVKMSAVGVPPKAVVHKMESDGVDAAKIELFKEYHGLVKAASTPAASSTQQAKTPREKYANLTNDDLVKDDTFAKYLKMKDVGVPLMAIAKGMSRDGIDKEKIQMFSVVHGISKPTSTRKSSAAAASPMRGRRASKALQKIHWTTVEEDKLENSLWASNNDSEVNDTEILRLEALFGQSPTRSGVVGQKKITAGSKSGNKKQTSLIDPKRANNIAISLAQFRAFTSFDDLCNAVATLDKTHLDVEKLTNMKVLLPTAEEVSSLKKYNRQNNDGLLSLGRAELFFLSVMKVPRFPQKLSAFRYMLQFDKEIEYMTMSLQLLATACTQIVESKKLAAILRQLLKLGNVMNESSGKSMAKGITLDSLIKTAKKKGNDGKTMMIDLVVSQEEINVDFKSDIPAVRDALRLDLDDIRGALRDVESEFQNIERSIEAEKKQQEGGESGQDDLASSSSSLFIARLVPFLTKASVEIQSIKNVFGQVEGNVKGLCSFFAEDSKTCKASTIFEVLLDFACLVDKSKEQHIRREKARQRKESLLAGKNKPPPQLKLPKLT